MEKPLIKRNVLREQVKKYLIELIMRGDYKAGQRLVETQIARDLGVSQAPVREAFRDLEQMGILRIEAYRGAFVPNMTIADLKDAYEVRAELESLAVSRAVIKMTVKQLVGLEKEFENMRKAAKLGDLQKLLTHDIEFHKIIVEVAGNKILEKVWNSVSIETWTFFGAYQNDIDLALIAERHLPIVEAFKVKDVITAKEEMRKHFIELKNGLENKDLS